MSRVFVRLLLDPHVSQADSLREADAYAAVFADAGDDHGLTAAQTLIGTILFWQGKAAVSEERFARAIEHARRAGDRPGEYGGLRWLALAISEGPTPAREGIRRLESIREQAGGNRSVEIGVAHSLASLQSMVGRFEEAREWIARGKALAAEIGDQVAVAAMTRESGTIELASGDATAAESELRVAYEILDSLKDIGHLSSTAPDLGDVLHEMDRTDEALRISEYTETISIEGDVDANVRWRQLRAKALARLGRLEEAEAFALDAVRMIAATDYLDLHAHALMALAEVRRLAGRTSDAAEAVGEAVELYRQKGNVVAERRATALLDELRSR